MKRKEHGSEETITTKPKTDKRLGVYCLSFLPGTQSGIGQELQALHRWYLRSDHTSHFLQNPRR
jgi:hypothetical protein